VDEAIQNVLAQPASENRRPSRPLISRAKPYQQFSLKAAEKKFRDFEKLQLRAPQNLFSSTTIRIDIQDGGRTQDEEAGRA
jgi:hypothetical protein